MSFRSWEFRIQDILSAANKICQYAEGKTFDEFVKNEMLLDAVIRQLTIIGEAATHLPEEITSSATDIPWVSIRGMRNVVVHEYFGINQKILWKTVTKNIPDLIFRLESLQKKLPQKG